MFWPQAHLSRVIEHSVSGHSCQSVTHTRARRPPTSSGPYPPWYRPDRAQTTCSIACCFSPPLPCSARLSVAGGRHVGAPPEVYQTPRHKIVTQSRRGLLPKLVWPPTNAYQIKLSRLAMHPMHFEDSSVTMHPMHFEPAARLPPKQKGPVQSMLQEVRETRVRLATSRLPSALLRREATAMLLY
jgi:hypothetical protein